MSRPMFLTRPGFWVLLVCIAGIVLERMHTYREPLENDIAGYAIIGHEMMHGRLLYSDLWERKPPLLYGIFAGAELITGYGRGEIFLVNITAAISTLIAVCIAGANGPSGRMGGWIAAVMWTLLCGDLFMQANQPNAEVLLNTFLTAAFALLICWPRDQTNWRASSLSALLLGMLFAGATLIKHHVIVTCTALAVAHIIVGFGGVVRRRCFEMATAFGVTGVCWGMVLGYFAAVGRWAVMTDVLFHQNAQYAGNLVGNLLISLKPANLFKPFLTWMICPLALVAVGLFAGFDRTSRPIIFKKQWLLWLGWVIGTWPAVVLPGHLFPHYFQLWIPVWCIAGGWAATAILDRRILLPTVVRYGTVSAVMTVLACRELSTYTLTPDEWAEQKYRGGNYVQQDQLGRFLGQTLLKPKEQFWVLGDDNSLYFAAKKSPPSGLLYLDPLTDGDETTKFNARLVLNLQRTKPMLVILSPLAERLPPDAPVFAWLKKDYTRWQTDIGQPKYHLFLRNGSRLK